MAFSFWLEPFCLASCEAPTSQCLSRFLAWSTAQNSSPPPTCIDRRCRHFAIDARRAGTSSNDSKVPTSSPALTRSDYSRRREPSPTRWVSSVRGTRRQVVTTCERASRYRMSPSLRDDSRRLTKMVVGTGVDPVTSRFSGARSTN